MNRVSILLLFVLLLSASCRDKLELNAPYKEIPFIYAVLNPYEKIQVIRINKIFLGEGDANVSATIADSVNYPAGQLKVFLTHSSGREIVMHDSVVQTEPGPFARQQRVYVTGAKLDTTGSYKLSVINNHTGNVFTSTARVYPRIPLTGLPPFTPPYYPVDKSVFDPYNPPSPNPYIDYSEINAKFPYSVRYATVSDVAIYNLVMRFHFFDTSETLPVTKFQYFDFPFGNQYYKDRNLTTSLLTQTFKAGDILYGAAISLNRLNLDPYVFGRRVFKIQFTVYGAGQDYVDFLEYAKPPLNISNQKPLYSNFDNRAAYGIFTFRTMVSVDKDIDYRYVNQFATNANTCGFRFMRYEGTVPGCK